MTSPQNGSGQPPTFSYPETGTAYIDALLYAPGKKWGTSLGTGASLTFSFPAVNAVWATGYNGAEPGGAAPFDPTMMLAARTALAAWADVSGLKFTEVQETATTVGDIRFSYTSVNHPTTPTSVAWAGTPDSFFASAGDVWVNSRNYNPATSTLIGGTSLMMHELGHAFGLSHPYDPPVSIPLSQQTNLYSVLGYGLANNVWTTSSNGVNTSTLVGASGPLLYDVAAIQYLYGANMATRTGDDTYSFDPSVPFFQCIWDAGGSDTISVSRFTGGCTIDLREGAFSSVAMRSPVPQASSSSYDGVNVLSIAYGAVIENAVGGQGADTLTGNAARNRLQGGGGNDTISGGAGADTAVFSGASAGYTVTGSVSAGFTVRDNTGSDGTDTLREVERLAFSDKGIAFDIDGAAGRAALLLNAVMGKASLQNRALVGTVMSLMDGGASIQVLSDALVRNGFMAQLAGGSSNTALVTWLFRSVVGSEPSAATVSALAGLIDAGALTQGQFLWKVTELPVNQATAGLTGLAQTGIEYAV